MKIDAIMTKKVITVGMDDTIHMINLLFHQYRFHHLPVVKDGILYGIISDRDLLKVTSPFVNTISEEARDLAIMKRKAHQIMSRNIISVTADTGIGKAVKLMMKENISCLPVVGEKNKFMGIVTLRDLLKPYLKLK